MSDGEFEKTVIAKLGDILKIHENLASRVNNTEDRINKMEIISEIKINEVKINPPLTVREHNLVCKNVQDSLINAIKGLKRDIEWGIVKKSLFIIVSGFGGYIIHGLLKEYFPILLKFLQVLP